MPKLRRTRALDWESVEVKLRGNIPDDGSVQGSYVERSHTWQISRFRGAIWMRLCHRRAASPIPPRPWGGKPELLGRREVVWRWGKICSDDWHVYLIRPQLALFIGRGVTWSRYCWGNDPCFFFWWYACRKFSWSDAIYRAKMNWLCKWRYRMMGCIGSTHWCAVLKATSAGSFTVPAFPRLTLHEPLLSQSIFCFLA